ncbi:MAG: phage tail protein [Pseudomonas sp.]|uniref:phage tail protein n=1 Tax=Pseudomonas sp. TaxID=306 RepID=UPI00235546E7|nr:phage tail protein [Pseudomonas sp.]MBS5840556.1 phage tail protein [Pseudomonas sp.]
MINPTSTFFAILTALGEAKQAQADASGTPWLITDLGVGDANGTDPVPDRLQTSLINEQRRAPLNRLSADTSKPGLLIAEQIIPPEVGGWWIKEMGLYDVDGDLIAVANCAPSYKPLLSQGSARTQVVRMVFVISSTANVALSVDPSVVVATREYVDEQVREAFQHQDYKASAQVATTESIALAGLQNIDGFVVSDQARVLVKNQTSPEENGLYTASPDRWLRSADADSNAKVTAGLLVHIEQGEKNADSLWQLISNDAIEVGVSALHFEMACGPTGIQAGTYRRVEVDRYGRVIAGSDPASIGFYLEVPRVAQEPVIYVPPFGLMEWRAERGIYRSVDCGDILLHGAATPKAGTLKANGQAINKSDYAGLWSWAQDNGLLVPASDWLPGTAFYCEVDADLFRIPDLRGEFAVAWDDSRAVDPGREFGSHKDSQNKAHTHSASTQEAGAHGHTASTDARGGHAHTARAQAAGSHAHTLLKSAAGNNTSGAYVSPANIGNSHATTDAGGEHTHVVTVDQAGNHDHAVSVAPALAHSHSVIVDSSGGNEAHPRNVALLCVIKF